jgi:cell division protein FtsN
MPKDYVHLTKPSRNKSTRHKLSSRNNDKIIKSKSSRQRTNPSSKKLKRLLIKFSISLLCISFLSTGIFWGVQHYGHDGYLKLVTYLKKRQAAHEKKTASKIQQKRIEKKAVAAKKNHDPEPVKFEFYRMIPNLSVDASTVTPEDLKALAKQKHITSSKLYTTYWVHLLSSYDIHEAQHLQQSLLHEQFNARIYQIDRGETPIYRVQIGPFYKKQSAVAIRERLRLRNIHSLITTLKE